MSDSQWSPPRVPLSHDDCDYLTTLAHQQQAAKRTWVNVDDRKGSSRDSTEQEIIRLAAEMAACRFHNGSDWNPPFKDAGFDFRLSDGRTVNAQGTTSPYNATSDTPNLSRLKSRTDEDGLTADLYLIAFVRPQHYVDLYGWLDRESFMARWREHPITSTWPLATYVVPVSQLRWTFPIPSPQGGLF